MAVDAKYWTEAKATGGGRNGTSGLVNGQLTVTMTSPKELGGSGAGHNPEELFAVGYAACYLGAMRFAAGAEKLGTVPDDATVTSAVGIGGRDDGGFGLTAKSPKMMHNQPQKKEIRKNRNITHPVLVLQRSPYRGL